jgi:hypothetical protein
MDIRTSPGRPSNTSKTISRHLFQLLSMAGTPIATLIHDGLQSYQFWFSVATAVSIGLQP